MMFRINTIEERLNKKKKEYTFSLELVDVENEEEIVNANLFITSTEKLFEIGEHVRINILKVSEKDEIENE